MTTKRVLTLALIGAVLAFYGWTVRSNTPIPPPLFGGEQSDYQNQRLHGMRHGHLDLEAPPDPRLAALADPYDPSRRPAGVGAHDVSYYRGHYYLYFGVTPVVSLLLPWRLATGHDLPQAYAILIFTGAGFLAAAALWLALRRRYFPEAGLATRLAGLAVLGLASMTLALLRRPDLWEEPVAAGYAFAMLALLCLYHGLHSSRAAAWLGAAGLCFGLAVGGRPDYAAGSVLFLALLPWIRRRPPGRRRAPLLAPLAALGAVAAGLLWYNYARFGNPLEFGEHYMLNGGEYFHRRALGLDFLGANAFLYYLAPAHWIRYFPFADMVRIPPGSPPIVEYVWGLLPNFPFAWFALAAPLAWRGRPTAEREPLRTLVGAIALLYGAMGIELLLFLPGVAARYMVDFVPALMLLAAIGLLALERAAGGRGRAAVRALAVGAAALSALVGVMASFQLHALFRQSNPVSFRNVAHAFDEPVGALERLAGRRFGPLELEVRFPRREPGVIEPLVTTGWEFETDCLFVRYLDGPAVQLGFDHSHSPVIWGPILPVDLAATHRLEVQLGSLYPPRPHPFFDGMDPFAANRLSRWLRVTLDGRVAFDQGQDFYDSSPGDVHVGDYPLPPFTYGRRFTGSLLSLRTGPVAIPAPPTGGYGVREFELSFPDADLAQPLVTTGQTGRGDILSVRRVGPGLVRFAYDHWGIGLWQSGDVPVTIGPRHFLRVSLPALLASPASGLALELDGRPVWREAVPFYPAPPDEFQFGRNGIGASSCEPEFTGVILGLKRL